MPFSALASQNSLFLRGWGSSYWMIFGRDMEGEPSERSVYLNGRTLPFAGKSCERSAPVRHDMKAHLSAVSHYLLEGQVEKAQEYLEKGEREDLGDRRSRDGRGESVDQCRYRTREREDGKRCFFLLRGTFRKSGFRFQYDLCAIFSNLLANAGEACRRLQEKKKKSFSGSERVTENC